MNIHKSQLFWCEQKGYKVLTHCHINLYCTSRNEINPRFGGKNRPVVPPKSTQKILRHHPVVRGFGTWTVGSAFAKWDSPQPLPRPDVWENPGVGMIYLEKKWQNMESYWEWLMNHSWMTGIYCYHGKSFWITGVLMQYGSNVFVSNIAGVADNTVHG